MDLDLLMESKIDIEKQRVRKRDDLKLLWCCPGARNKKY